MPVSKKRKKPEKKRHQRDAGETTAAEPQAAAAEPVGRGGFLSRMRGGFQSVTGSGPKKPESMLSKILTWALVAAVAYFLAKRFGILK